MRPTKLINILQANRDAILIANYELTPNMADHKNRLQDSVAHEIS